MKKSVIVTTRVEIEVDEAKFDESFLSEFRKSFYNFRTIKDHIEHLAQLSARGCIGSFGDCPEGYDTGMLIKHTPEVIEVEIED